MSVSGSLPFSGKGARAWRAGLFELPALALTVAALLVLCTVSPLLPAARPKSPVSPMIASTMQRVGTSRSTTVAVLRPNGRPEISRLATPASPTAPGDQHREDQGDAAAEGEPGKQRENP
jgi:hypothetical protein